MPKRDADHLSIGRARRIVEECYPEVLAYCRRHAPIGHEAVDLAQETFLRFARSDTYQERGKPIAYLMRIARSVCADAARKRRLETIPLEFDVAYDEPMLGDDAISDALARLPQEQQDAIELRFGSELALGEVAKALGISRFSVRRRLKAAMRALKHELGEGDQRE